MKRQLFLTQFFILTIFVIQISAAGPRRWTTNGPYGGNIFDVDIHPQQQNVLFASVFPRGFYKSVNSGSSWVKILDRNRNMKIGGYDLEIDFKNPNIFYLASHAGVYKSTDGGESWHLPSFWERYSLILDVEMNPFYPQEVLAVSAMDGLFKTNDSGITWKKLGFDHISVYCLEYDNNQPNLVYIGTDFVEDMDLPNGFCRSTDGGETWEVTFHDKDVGDFQTIKSDPNQPGVVYGGGLNKALFKNNYPDAVPYRSLFKSQDYGISWECINTGLKANFVLSFLIDSHDSNILYVGTEIGLFKSTNAGTSWQKAGKGIHELKIFSIALDEKNNILYVGTYMGGVYKSTDGGETFQDISTGITERAFRSLEINPLNPNTMFLACATSLFKTMDNGQSWKRLAIDVLDWHGPSRSIKMDPLDTNTVYMGTYWSVTDSGAGVARSEDGGSSWERKMEGLPADVYINDLDVYADSIQHLIFITSSDGLYQSNDRGETWQKNALTHPYSFWGIGIHPQDPNTVFVSGLIDFLFKSTDGGQSWRVVDSGNERAFWEKFYFNPHNPDHIFARCSHGIFRSLDRGETWELFKQDGSTVIIHPENPQRIYAGMKKFADAVGGGVELSENGGITWKNFDMGFDWNKPAIYQLQFDPFNPQKIYAAGHGLWSYTRTPAAIEPVQNLPANQSFTLCQNYPNPFNPATGITYTLPRASHVRLKIFNLQGQLILNLVNSQQIPGSYSIQWSGTNANGRQVAGGIYIYQLVTEYFTASRKMLFLR